jgi:hypothetical protein
MIVFYCTYTYTYVYNYVYNIKTHIHQCSYFFGTCVVALCFRVLKPATSCSRATTQGLQPTAATISSLCRQGQGQDIDVAGGCWCFVVVFDVDVGKPI